MSNRYVGSENARHTSVVVPAAGDKIQTDEGGSYTGDGVTLAQTAFRDGEAPLSAGPLAKIDKAQTGVFKVVLLGTSKQTFDEAACQMYAQHLQALFGDTQISSIRAGMLNSLQAYQGWGIQYFSGLFQYRLAGISTSTPIVRWFYGDTLTVEFSRETDSEAVNIQVDGVTVGVTPAAGAQALSQIQTFTVSGYGPHTATINVPAGAGKVYFEYLSGGKANRTGVEVRDATLGGSLLDGLVHVPVATGSLVTSVPTVGDNGINACFNRPDVDLFVMGYIVNDAGYHTIPWQTTGNYGSTWKPTMDKIAAVTAANEAKLALIIETPGHYIMGGPTDTMHQQFLAMADYCRVLAKQWSHITCVDHFAAMAPPSNLWTDQTTIDTWRSRFYGNCTGVNVAANTYTGDFIHDVGGDSNRIGVELLCRASSIRPPVQAVASLIREDAARTPANAATLGRDKLVTIAGVTKRMAAAYGFANVVRAPTAGANFYAIPQVDVVPYYRDVNAAASDLGTPLQALIDASGTSDAYGRYLTTAGYNLTLGSVVGWAGGARRMLTIKGRNVQVKTNAVSQLYSDTTTGGVLPITSGTLTAVTYTTNGAEPQTVAVAVGAPSNGQYVTIVGDLYEVCFADSTVPVLVKNAPPAPAAGPAGPTSPEGAWPAPGRDVSVTVAGPITTTTVTLQNEVCVPISFSVPGSLDIGRIWLSTGIAGSSARIGLRASDGSGPPGALLADFGLVTSGTGTTSGTGVRSTGTLATPVAVAAGVLYYATIYADSPTTVPIFSGINGSHPAINIPAAGATGPLSAYRIARGAALAALPAAFGGAPVADNMAVRIQFHCV